MGRFLNPGNELFQMTLNSEIYVDKSGIISQLNRLLLTQERFVCVSRPRRFGKTVTLSMLTAYYGRGIDSRAQFEGLQVASSPSFERHLNAYDVISINIQNFLSEAKSVEEMLEFITEDVAADLGRAYPDLMPARIRSLANVLDVVNASTHVPFIFVIDEWDCVFRLHQHDAEAQKLYLDWLRNLLKDRSYVALAYMTGILPIKKYGQHSALNMFSEISMTDAVPFSEFTGFTEGEIEDLCERYQAPIEEMRRWYDGYDVDGEAIYNPRSVVQSLMRGSFNNYWTQTETFDALRVYIEMDLDGLREKIVRLLAGEQVSVDITTFQNDMTTLNSADDVLTLLVHLGYLTFDRATRMVRVPNLEVAQQYGSILRADGWAEVARALKQSDALLEAMLAGDGEQVAQLVADAHEDASSILTYNDENSLACTLSLAFYAARRNYVMIRELPAGKGFADVVLIPRVGSGLEPVIIELKASGAGPREALEQMRERGYGRALEGLTGNVLLVGITYDPKTKQHECQIEKTVLGE